MGRGGRGMEGGGLREEGEGPDKNLVMIGLVWAASVVVVY